MRLRLLLSVLTAVVGAVALSVVSVAPAVGAEGCPNEAIREAQHSTYLPDCRAYEQVSPAGKDNGEVQTLAATFFEAQLDAPAGMYAAESGERMAWTSEYPLPGSTWPGLDYLSTRGSQGWHTEGVIPSQSTENGVNCPQWGAAIASYSANLSQSVLVDGNGQNAGVSTPGLNCGHDEPRLAAGELPNDQNLFVRANEASPTYRLVDVTPAEVTVPGKVPGNEPVWRKPSFLSGSATLSTVVFEEELPLTEDAPGWPNEWEAHDNLYAWSASSGTDSLITVLPNGTSVLGMLAGATRNGVGSGELSAPNVAGSRYAISADGSRIFFEAEGKLYARENPTVPDGAGDCTEAAMPCTIELDLPQGGSGPGGGGKFVAANAAGTKVFFTDGASAGLTEHTEAGSGANLYEYQLPSEAGKAGTLVDLTAKATIADVLGLAGSGEAGKYVYYVAEGTLTGDQKNSRGDMAQSGQPNLYEAHEGATTFIATLDPNADLCDWEAPACVKGFEGKGAVNEGGFRGGSSARVSANGGYVAFNSDRELTGYANAGPHCVPLGAGNEPILRPHSKEGHEIAGYGPGACQEIFLYDATKHILECASCGTSGKPPAAPALLRFPGGVSQDGEMEGRHLQRNVANNGAVFFESAQPLVPAASDGKVNVYEYEDGRVHLISSGTSEANSVFLEATPDGSNVFFATNEALVRSDTDHAYDIYDARVEGGFPEPTAPQAPCASEGCKGAGTGVATFSAPGSATFTGGGNLSQQRKRSTGAKQKSMRKRLRRTLRHCARVHRNSRRKRQACKRRARRRFAAKGARHRRHRNRGLAAKRARREHKHGGKR